MAEVTAEKQTKAKPSRGRARRIAKWAGPAVCAVFALVYLASLLWYVAWFHSAGAPKYTEYMVLIEQGNVTLRVRPNAHGHQGLSFGSSGGPMVWVPVWDVHPGFRTEIAVPLWMPLIAAGVVVALRKFRGPPASSGYGAWRKRRVLKWAGVGVCAVMLAAWVWSATHSLNCMMPVGASRPYNAQYFQTSLWILKCEGGAVLFERGGTLTPGAVQTVCYVREPDGQWWLPRLAPRTIHEAVLPIWMPLVLIALFTGVLWRRDYKSRRRHDCCPKCDYDRRGLVDGAACPECGAWTSAA